MTEPIGHVDFYPNGGSVQPGCKQYNSPSGLSNDVSYQNFVKLLGCNHERSHEYFIESIAPSCPFMAVQCESYDVSTTCIIIIYFGPPTWNTLNMSVLLQIFMFCASSIIVDHNTDINKLKCIQTTAK